MLVLTRHRDESIIIGHLVRVTVVEIRGDKVRIGVEAQSEVTVNRQEIEAIIDRKLDHSPDETGVTVDDLRSLEELEAALRMTITKEANLRRKIAAKTGEVNDVSIQPQTEKPTPCQSTAHPPRK